jgi:hypothetical protein
MSTGRRDGLPREIAIVFGATVLSPPRGVTVGIAGGPGRGATILPTA